MTILPTDNVILLEPRPRHVGPNNGPLKLTVSWDHCVHVQLSTVSRSGRGWVALRCVCPPCPCPPRPCPPCPFPPCPFPPCPCPPRPCPPCPCPPCAFPFAFAFPFPFAFAFPH